MRTGSYFARAPRAVRTSLSACSLGSCLALAAIGVSAPLALASSTPHYSMSVSEGETTLPEFPILQTSVRTPHNSEAVLSIVRNGIAVARNAGNGGTQLSQAPQVGDVVTLESPVNVLIAAVQYDGLPSLDAAVCAGSEDFSGQRTLNEEVSGGYFTATPKPYGWWEEAAPQSAQLAAEVGNAFAGNFLKPLALGQTVFANESVTSTLASGATFTYESENARPVGGCPPPPPPPPPPLPALSGSIFKITSTTIRKLLRFGWGDQVIINQPGTVTQDLYLTGGKLPAFAASAKRHHKPKQPPALLLARGTASAAAAGTVKVKLKVTARGRSKLKRERKVKAVLMTTLTTAGGQKVNLGSRTLSLRL